MPRSLLKADVRLALMMPGEDGQFHPSEAQVYPYYFAVNWTLTPELHQDIHDGLMFILQRLYAAHRVFMQAREPDDHTWMAVMDVDYQIVPPEQYASEPWRQSECPVWEDTNCMVVNNDQFQKVPRQAFAETLRPVG